MLNFWINDIGSDILLKAERLLQSSDSNILKISASLRKTFPDISIDFISSALEFAILRQKAAPLGAWTSQGFFTRQSLEQATNPAISVHHAEIFRGCNSVLEICTGIGFDTAALAKVAKKVVSIEQNEEVAEFARYNLRLQGIENVEILTDNVENLWKTTAFMWKTTFDGVWCDPSRRDERGNRVNNPERYSPPLSFVISLPVAGIIGVKLSPALNLTTVKNDWSKEWIGFGAECREQILWKGAKFTGNRVSLIEPSKNSPDFVLSQKILNSETIVQRKIFNYQTQKHGNYLIETHNALIRSGCLQEFFDENEFSFLDENIAYGISEKEPPESKFYQTFRIIEIFQYNFKLLKKRMLELGWGNRTEIKKRGFPEEPEAIRKQLKLPQSDAFGVIFLTRVGNGHLAILAKRNR